MCYFVLHLLIHLQYLEPVSLPLQNTAIVSNISLNLQHEIFYELIFYIMSSPKQKGNFCLNMKYLNLSLAHGSELHQWKMFVFIYQTHVLHISNIILKKKHICLTHKKSTYVIIYVAKIFILNIDFTKCMVNMRLIYIQYMIYVIHMFDKTP